MGDIYFWLGFIVFWAVVVIWLAVCVWAISKQVVGAGFHIYAAFKTDSISDKWKQKRFWRTRLILDVVFNWKYLENMKLSNSDYEIDFESFIPKLTIYDTK